MEIMKRVAERHGMVCLLHEKPFEGVNGSGKHNNWSISTDTGVNLLEPGKLPHENAQFITFLCAVIKAVDDYQEMLRISAASAGNDHRLGANEAPPAIISIFLGDELTEILEAIEGGTEYEGTGKRELEIGVHVLPHFAQDTTDRNRTSPFAFTGNKFEFRMVGSSLSISGPNIVLNTAIAEILKQFADELEPVPEENFNAALNKLIKRTIRNHKRIIFNGNGYDDAWIKEAEKRGLRNLPSTPDALPEFISEKNIKLFTDHKVLTEAEMHSRYEIHLENYCKVLGIEANTMVSMAKKYIFPSVTAYIKDLSNTVNELKAAVPNALCTAETELIVTLSKLLHSMYEDNNKLEELSIDATKITDLQSRANHYRDFVIPYMAKVRASADELELITAKKYWPMPTYGDLIYKV